MLAADSRFPLSGRFILLGLWAGALVAQVPSSRPAPLPRPAPPLGHVAVGDMWLPESVVYGEGAFAATPWTAGHVYYRFDLTMASYNRPKIRAAMAEIMAVCDVEFFEVDGSFNGNRVLIAEDQGGAYYPISAVGMQGGQQDLVLPTSIMDQRFELVHHLMHVLGFVHEHQRVDRDLYVNILWNNIYDGHCTGGPCSNTFLKIITALPLGPYDFRSVMHGSRNDHNGGSGGLNTMEAQPAYASLQGFMGQRFGFSQGDSDALQAVYGQPAPPTITACTPSAVTVGSQSAFTVQITGTRFHVGALLAAPGWHGTRVRVNGVVVETTFIDETTLRATIPAELVPSVGSYAIDVINNPEQGGASLSSVNLNLIPPPCQSANDRFGHALVGLGDVNGNGHGDFAIGSPGTGNNSGTVSVRDGGNGTILWLFPSLLGPGGRAGHALARNSDLNNDGVADLAVGMPGYQSDRGLVRFYSGATGGALSIGALSQVSGSAANDDFGTSIALVGDVDGDGDSEFLVGALGSAGVGRVELWSTSGQLMRTHTSGATTDAYGWSVGGGHDVNLDGIPDYCVGAPDWNNGTIADVGRVHVYSGQTGALLTTRNGDGQYDRFGFSVALTGSTQTGGPYGNLVVGAPEIPNLFTGIGNGNGYVRVFGPANPFGNNYPTLFTLASSALGDRYGAFVGPAGDPNDDGAADLLIGAPQATALNAGTGPGYCEIRSGRNGAILHRHQGSGNDEQTGWSAALIGDTNGDAQLDYVIGAPSSDDGCIDAGRFFTIEPPIPPALGRVLITEVSTGNPDCVEVTNFGSSQVNLGGWTLRWKDLSVYVSSSLTANLGPGQSLVVKEPGGSLPEVPAGTTILDAFSPLPTALGDFGVALVSNTGIVVDEVQVQGNLNFYSEGSLGGKFRGVVVHQSTSASEVNAARIWGLDSNAGRDWTTGGPRTMGLRNTSAGERGTDPQYLSGVVINEIDDDPDFIELHRPTEGLASYYALNLQGWYLLTSSNNGNEPSVITPFTSSLNIPAGGYVVVGDTATPPSELVGGTPYRFDGGNIPFVTEEYSCALYDRYGRLVDLVRTTGHDDPVPHNEPRAPSHWSDFSGVAPRDGTGSGAIGRNAAAFDANFGDDFRPRPIRTMGGQNFALFMADWVPEDLPALDVILNDTASGQGITAILHAGSRYAGFRWTFTYSFGHLQGTGPILGLGPDAVNNWLTLSATPPFFGLLDSRGTARLDFPPMVLPPGLDTDDIFLLQLNDGNPFSAPVLFSAILEFDT